MVRLAVRRTTTRSNRSAAVGARATGLRSLAKGSAASKVAVKIALTNQAEIAKVKAILNPLNDFIKMRKRNYGANDMVAKKMQTISTALNKELRKKFIFNATFAKHLNQLTPTLRGVTNVPQNLKNNILNLKKFIKTHANSQVMEFNNHMKKLGLLMIVELKKLQMEFAKEIARARNTNTFPHVNPMIKQRFLALQRQFIAFKTYWVKHLTKFRLHSSKELQSSLNQIKSLMEDKQREFNRNLIILNRYAKTARGSNKKLHPIFSPGILRALEWKWEQIKNETNKFKPHMPRYHEQLKVAKQF